MKYIAIDVITREPSIHFAQIRERRQIKVAKSLPSAFMQALRESSSQINLKLIN